MLFGLLPGTSQAEQTQTPPVADAHAAETPESAVPATQTPTETLEAETVSLSKDQVRVIKGGTTTLTAEIPEDQRGETPESPLTASSAIVWTSSNPEVATVDSNGVVTGIELGEATITATLNGSVIENYAVYSTLNNGLYVLEPYSTLHTLGAAEIALYGVYLETLPYSHDDLRSAIGDTWYINYLGSNYYSIHPAFSRCVAIGIYGGAVTLIPTSSDISATHWQWQIEPASSGYILRNRYDTTQTITPSSEDDYSIVVCETISSTDTSQHWSISTAAFQIPGMLLFDLRTGELVADDLSDNDSEICSGDVDIYTGKGGSYELEELSFYAQPLDHSSLRPPISMSFSGSYVTYNSTTRELTGTQLGSVYGSIYRTISGTAYTVDVSVHVVESVPVAVQYDQAYASRYSDYSSRIAQQTDALEEKFRTEFGIFLSIGTPSLFQSHADTCPTSSGYLSECSCEGTCSNSVATNNQFATYPAIHHKNAYNMLVRLNQNESSKLLAYIGHNACFKYGVDHYINGSSGNNYIYGLSIESWGVCEVLDHTSLTNSISTTIHEVGHLFGAEDHYDNGCLSTNSINQKYNTNLFCRVCIYGEYYRDESVISDIKICAGCRALINKELPESEEEGD